MKNLATTSKSFAKKYITRQYVTIIKVLIHQVKHSYVRFHLVQNLSPYIIYIIWLLRIFSGLLSRNISSNHLIWHHNLHASNHQVTQQAHKASGSRWTESCEKLVGRFSPRILPVVNKGWKVTPKTSFNWGNVWLENLRFEMRKWRSRLPMVQQTGLNTTENWNIFTVFWFDILLKYLR